MVVIPECEWSSVRAEMADTMPETGTILRLTRTPDDMGGGADTWAASGTVSLRISPALFFPTEGQMADRIAGRVTWYLTFPALTDITSPDRLAANGRLFEIIGVYGPKSFEVTRRAIAVESD